MTEIINYINNKSLLTKKNQSKDKHRIKEKTSKNKIKENDSYKHYGDLVDLIRVQKLYFIESPLNTMVSFNDKLNRLNIYFPTPYKYSTAEQEKQSTQYSRNLINESIDKNNPSKIILDLRGNYGGKFTLFLDALYPVLPVFDLVVEGVNLDDEVTNEIILKNNIFKITDHSKEIFSKEIDTGIKHNIPIKLIIDERSMSSSQLLAIIFRYLYGDNAVDGYAPELYTNGSTTICIEESQHIIPTYIFRIDGKTYTLGYP